MLQTLMIGTTRPMFLRDICQGKTTLKSLLVSGHNCVLTERVLNAFGISVTISKIKDKIKYNFIDPFWRFPQGNYNSKQPIQERHK